MKSGIYKILNKHNGKFYIGSAFDLDKRWTEHKYHLNRLTHKNSYLQNAWNKYGSVSFEFIIIEICDKENLIIREQYWIDNLKPEYNLAKIAGSRAGVSMPEIAKIKIGANSKRHLTGRKMSQQHKDAISKANSGKQFRLGQKQSAEEKEKRAASHRGKKRSLEAKLRMSEAQRKWRKLNAVEQRRSDHS